MDSIRYMLLALILTLLGTGTASADVLLLESIQSAPEIATPRAGMSMARVRETFGEPAKENPAIGDPPITRWDYPGYSVFFEYDLVLHSVIKRPEAN